jgi:hypothetical protein
MTGSQPLKGKKHQFGLPRFQRFFGRLGPGLTATFGYAPLWTAPVLLSPWWASEVCPARLGLVAREGLAGVIRRQYRVVWTACSLLVIANTVNIGADLGGMATVLEMVTAPQNHNLDRAGCGRSRGTARTGSLVWARSARVWWAFRFRQIQCNAVAEGALWRGRWQIVPLFLKFYGVIAVGVMVGLVLDYAGSMPYPCYLRDHGVAIQPSMAGSARMGHGSRK